MRLPYTPNPPTALPAEDLAIVARVQARRAPSGLLPLDLALLHAPKIADGWNSLLGAVRTRSSLPDDIRELCICRVARVNEAWFEWNAHYPLLCGAEGFDEKTMGAVVKELEPKSRGNLSGRQWAVVRFADAMTRDVRVADEVFEAVKGQGFSEREIVEITTTVAAYNMVSRFLVALDVGECNSEEVPVL